MVGEACAKLKAQHQQGARQKLELADRVTSLRVRLADVLQGDQFPEILNNPPEVEE